MDTPSVSIIIVNWNGESFLKDCLHSLYEQTYKDFEIIFVDNGSSDNSIETARQLAQNLALQIRIIELPDNKGFTGGNIEGLKHCTGKHIALLNNDTEASAEWLASLIKGMDSDPAIGICASRLLVAGTYIIDSAGDGYATFGRAFKRGEGFPASLYDSEEYVFGACAGAALYRKKMIDQIGFMDEDFFLYMEDADLNFRAQLSGWKCLYVPGAVVLHKVNASSRFLGDLPTYYGVRNDKIVKMKNVPLSIMLFHLPCFILNELISLQYHIRIGRFRSYLRGNLDFFKNLPLYFEKRRKTMKNKKVSARYIESLLTSGFSVYLGLPFYRLKASLRKRQRR